jgi:hypothetical protein
MSTGLIGFICLVVIGCYHNIVVIQSYYYKPAVTRVGPSGFGKPATRPLKTPTPA